VANGLLYEIISEEGPETGSAILDIDVGNRFKITYGKF